MGGSQACDKVCCHLAASAKNLGHPVSADDGDNLLEPRAACNHGFSNSLHAYADLEVVQNEMEITQTHFSRELSELRELAPQSGEGPRRRLRHVFSTGSIYDGEWKGNMRHGLGMQVWEDGAVYSGIWEDNAATGHGKFAHPNGDYFIGQWYCNSAHGLGTMFNHEGIAIYKGQWVHDLRHGEGLERWEGGEYYGQFVWGKKHGVGVYEWPDSSVYSGEWRSNSIQGHGHYKAWDGREFKGTWQEAVIHGQGKYEWPDGRAFAGQYVRDRKEGFGVFTWPGGKIFEGWWLDGKQHGHGIMRQEDVGIIKQGVWVNGQSPADFAKKEVT